MYKSSTSTKFTDVIGSGHALPSHPQYIGIDALRFFAAIIVMLFHLVYLSSARQGTTYWISGGLISLPDAWPFTHWGWIGVQIFFVISGFVIALTAEHATVRSFIVSRVTRLVPAVWICAPLTFLFSMIFLGDHRYQELLHSLFFFPYGPWVEVVYWTLGIELAFYALVLVLIAMKRFYWIRDVALVIGASSTAFWIVYTIASLQPASPFFTSMQHLAVSRLIELLLIHHGCQFALGILLWHQLKRPSRQVSMENWISIGIFTIGSCMQINGHSYEENARVVHSFSAWAPVIAWIVTMAFLHWSIQATEKLSKLPKAMFRVFRRLGLMTYPLYLVHLTTGAYVMGFFARRGLSSAPAALCGMLFVIVLSWVISVYLEQPVQKLTRHLLSQTHDKARAKSLDG